ncbi:tripartite motif-containing protein 42-like [Ruditapes philippinarum]|uniref:tripartite motif-containing protein 42-like n=1 Tax=Ruditapes philippinarum TaxID=129788 RepID=UPI00295BE970|nr:tripartite motif-containing protein 42-like [Ruditapes philippinarum]
MAEVDGRSTITDIDIVCTPCFEGDIREQAVKYCPECLEFLCTGCTQHHGRLRISRSHKLVDKNEAKQKSHVTVTAKCLYHPDRDIEMYCKEHDMVYCLKCIATDHRSCTGVTSLDDLSVSTDQKRETERLKADIMNTQERLENTDKKTNLKSIEEQRNEVISQIEGLARGLVEHIQKLECEALEGLDAEYSKVKGELETDISNLSKAKQEIEQVRSQLKDLDSLNKIQQFVQTKLTQQTLNDAETVFGQTESKGIQSLYLKENTELKSSVSSSTSLGSVQKIAENKSQPTSTTYKVSSWKEENIRMKNDKLQPYICDACQLQDGTIILADNNNMKIKRLDVNYNIKDCLDLESNPRGICCTGNTEVAVILHNNKVWFISVGSSLSKVRDISVTDGGYYGMTYCAGELWVSNGKGVYVYSTTGTLLNSIINDVNGQRIFTSIKHMTVSGENVFVADSSNGVVCLTRDGTVKRERKDKMLADTRGVCASNDGTVFISGCGSNNIMMFDSKGKCLGELVSQDFGLVNPLSLLFDEKRNCLVVACYSGKMIVYYI